MKSVDEVVYLFNDNIIVVDQNPNRDLEDIKAYLSRVEFLLQERKTKQSVVLNTENVRRPNTEMRIYIRKRMKELKDKFDHIAICSGKKQFANTTASFLLGFIGYKNYSVHTTFEESIDFLLKFYDQTLKNN
ncbi:hypothetical protein K6119_00515 [Paracrocinitomix mangrovi]|uniref:hypothetical protein n=1 Tax=Paracrocinitomix mangrovi TaxID=2862509 RepID=UPI001C8DCF61|nr:hypothetical protein [Paracrocinitomix mangrovi]UKN01997.1 hypothetical protein K6119_00515 [Paracrocinitomix mangrovi]